MINENCEHKELPWDELCNLIDNNVIDEDVKKQLKMQYDMVYARVDWYDCKLGLSEKRVSELEKSVLTLVIEYTKSKYEIERIMKEKRES